MHLLFFFAFLLTKDVHMVKPLVEGSFGLHGQEIYILFFPHFRCILRLIATLGSLLSPNLDPKVRIHVGIFSPTLGMC